jgi:hypothetical protein
MNPRLVDQIVRTVLYEGYMLYPYRASSTKNRQRWSFGIVYPQAYSVAQAGAEPASMTTECLVTGASDAVLHVTVCFFHQDVERSVTLDDLRLDDLLLEPRTQHVAFGVLQGTVNVHADQVGDQLFKIGVHILNTSPWEPAGEAASEAGSHRPPSRHEELMARSMLSTHTILGIEAGEFVSLIDPPDKFREAAGRCRNAGTWPVLVGSEPHRDCMLSSPIILYDYPQVAPESPGDLFDATEIDEILTLRVLTLTKEEKEEAIRSDERVRRLLERTESLTQEQLRDLHGRMRSLPEAPVKPGDRVRLHPKPGGDVFDVVLDGRTAFVESVERDFEDKVHVAVVVEDDPGKDLGFLRQPGHRFFFSIEEVEVLR